MERDLVEMVDHVLGDVLLRAGELVEARGDVGGERLVALRGGRHRNGSRHGPTDFRRPCRGVLLRWRPDGAPSDPTRRSRPPRSGGARGRPRVLHGDVAGRRLGGPRRARDLRAGQPLALPPRHAARHPLPDGPGSGQARARRARARAGRRRRPAQGLADLRGVGGGRARRRARRAAVDPGGLRARLLRAVRRRRLRLQVHELLRPGHGGGHPLRRPGRRDRVAARPRAPLLRARPHGADARRSGRRAPLPSRRMSRDGRFAPSPTGTLHLGNLRTALLAWLFARSAGARFVVRMEDLDYGRVRAGAAARQLEDLAALGLDWDGDVVFQSSRVSAYAAAVERLRAAGLVYECFCTRAEIRAAASAPHGPLPEGAYPGTCLRLSEGERRRKRAGGRPPALRVHADGARVAFTDRLRGPEEGGVDDFVVPRNDGAPAYNLAVGVDDAWQGIGEVVGGHDLLDSTPRQLFLAGVLGLEAATYAHVPVVLGRDGARLAKRHGAVTLDDVAPRAALGWMAGTLGLPPAERAAELLEAFDPDAIPREP